MTLQTTRPRTYRERLSLLPQDIHITVKTYNSPYGTYYRAFWHEPGSGRYSKQRSLYLGKDQDGTIAAYLEKQQSYKKHSLTKGVTIYDELGQPLTIDEDLSHFFVGEHHYTKTIFVIDKKRYVFDACIAESGKYVRLERWLWECFYEEEVRGGKLEIVQKKVNDDYTINNLVKQEKKKDGKAA